MHGRGSYIEVSQDALIDDGSEKTSVTQTLHHAEMTVW